MHPDFEGIIEDTLELRNRYFPDTKISVLSNGMNVGKQSVFEALTKIDNPIMKLDSAFDDTVRIIDRLKAIHVGHDDGKLRPFAENAVDFPVKGLLHVSAVV